MERRLHFRAGETPEGAPIAVHVERDARRYVVTVDGDRIVADFNMDDFAGVVDLVDRLVDPTARPF
jgi:hypothetical protein